MQNGGRAISAAFSRFSTLNKHGRPRLKQNPLLGKRSALARAPFGGERYKSRLP